MPLLVLRVDCVIMITYPNWLLLMPTESLISDNPCSLLSAAPKVDSLSSLSSIPLISPNHSKIYHAMLLLLASGEAQVISYLLKTLS